ncbi:hypothetical protein OAV64_02020 [Candidatus Pelagibacter sp.]|nr:hypothetical protein [Candidatus Pelagibacter sp.]
MKKTLITFGLILFVTNVAFSNETKCSDFKKFSKEYLKCNANKIKKATINKANEIKDGTVEKTENLKQGTMKLVNKAKDKIKKEK